MPQLIDRGTSQEPREKNVFEISLQQATNLSKMEAFLLLLPARYVFHKRFLQASLSLSEIHYMCDFTQSFSLTVLFRYF